MLKVAFWVFGLLKSTKHELVLVCFNTPIKTMKLLLVVLSTAIALTPLASFAVTPIKFTPGSFCGVVASAKGSTSELYSINVRKGQHITINTSHSAASLQLVNPNNVTSDLNGEQNFSFTARYSGNYTLRFYAGDSAFYTPDLIVCAK